MTTVFCSDPNHLGWPYLRDWCEAKGFELVSSKEGLNGGDFLFLVSCTEIVKAEDRKRYDHVLVLHESDLPRGRGWSPLAWQILDGHNQITVTLLEAHDSFDSGPVWAKRFLRLEGHELADEITAKVMNLKIELMEFALNSQPIAEQQEGEPTYYRRRSPKDSRLDVNASIASQFDLLRICEPRFPAFFEHRGHTYKVTVSK